MENRFLPLAPADLRRKPEPVPCTQVGPATWKYGWSKHGSSIIPSKHSILQEWYSPCLNSTNYARTMFTPTMFSRRRGGMFAAAVGFPAKVSLNSFQTTLTPHPERFYECDPVHTCHILPPSEIDLGLCLAVFAGSGGKYLFHRIGWKGRIWQLCCNEQ